MRRWGLLSILVTIVVVWLMPSSWHQAKFFLGAFGLGLGVVLIMIGKLPWRDEEKES